MNTVLNAPWIARQANDLLAQRGHAWLLQGPSGLGQYELALALVSAWLCEKPTVQGACGNCPSCHAVAVRTHADLAVLMPETVMIELGWPLSEKAQDEIDKKTRKPSKEIRVDAMRDAVEFSQRTDARGRGKAVLVFPAERMNTITANTLLKTLEEPPGDVRFVLAAEAAHMLLPTIRSRCLAHTMKWPEADEALTWLSGQGVTAPVAQSLLRSAGGRPTDVLRQAESGLSPDWWAALPKAMRGGDARHLANMSPAQAIDALQKLCHDLVLRHSGAAPRFFDASQLPPSHASVAVLSDWFKRLMQSSRTAEHPFNAGLMLEALTADAQQTMLSKG
ncbi:MAG: polymerase subunit delta [Pseudomonadota bacterium]